MPNIRLRDNNDPSLIKVITYTRAREARFDIKVIKLFTAGC
jgi:hypothetical protein